MERMRAITLFLMGLGLLAVILGCGGQASPSTTTTATTTPSRPTFGQFANSGKTVFASNCAKCHGDQGQGGGVAPAVTGPSANLAKYATAQGLLDYVDKAMPADAPGSLSRQEYLQVLCFLLVQNNFASGGAAFDESALAGVQLK